MLYEELGWETLSDRRWIRGLTMHSKILNGKVLSYLNLPPEKKCNSFIFKNSNISNSFFPFCISQWDYLDDSTKSVTSLIVFKRYLLNLFRPNGYSY